MGNILNIRVIAQTLNEEEVAKAWPGLCALVWPEWAASLNLWPLRMKKLFGPTLGPSPVEKALGKRRHGVAELAEGLGDLLSLGLSLGNLPNLPARVAEGLREPGDKVAAALKGLNAALEGWNPKEANAMSNALETALDQAELALGKISA